MLTKQTKYLQNKTKLLVFKHVWIGVRIFFLQKGLGRGRGITRVSLHPQHRLKQEWISTGDFAQKIPHTIFFNIKEIHRTLTPGALGTTATMAPVTQWTLAATSLRQRAVLPATCRTTAPPTPSPPPGVRCSPRRGTGRPPRAPSRRPPQPCPTLMVKASLPPH